MYYLFFRFLKIEKIEICLKFLKYELWTFAMLCYKFVCVYYIWSLHYYFTLSDLFIHIEHICWLNQLVQKIDLENRNHQMKSHLFTLFLDFWALWLVSIQYGHYLWLFLSGNELFCLFIIIVIVQTPSLLYICKMLICIAFPFTEHVILSMFPFIP